MKVVKIIPYFGSWPPYFNFYLKTCKSNPHLDIYFFTDLTPHPDAPPNVSFINIEFRQLKGLIRVKTGVGIPDISPYKLCDFRAAYGLIFEDYIQDFDFWAYGDIDLVYGDLNYFITEKRLQEYDILSFKKGHLHGPFTIYRNCDYINSLFKKGNYIEIFLDLNYRSFDEFGPNVFYTKIKNQSEILNLPNNNISVIVFKESIIGNIRIFNTQRVKENLVDKDIVVYENGKVYDFKTKENYLFYHWVLEKRAIWYKYPKWANNVPTKFYMSTTGFYNEAEFKNYKFHHSVRWMKGMVRWWHLKAMNYIKRKMGLNISLDTYQKKRLGKTIKLNGNKSINYWSCWFYWFAFSREIIK